MRLLLPRVVVVECVQTCGAMVAESCLFIKLFTFFFLERAAAHGNGKTRQNTGNPHGWGTYSSTSPGTRRGHGIHIHSAILTILTRGCAERGVLVPVVMAAVQYAVRCNTGKTYIHTQNTCMHTYTKCTTRWYIAPQQEVSTHPCARVMKKREHRNVVGVRLYSKAARAQHLYCISVDNET